MNVFKIIIWSVLMGAFGAALSSIGLKYDMWEFYAICAPLWLVVGPMWVVD